MRQREAMRMASAHRCTRPANRSAISPSLHSGSQRHFLRSLPGQLNQVRRYVLIDRATERKVITQPVLCSVKRMRVRETRRCSCIRRITSTTWGESDSTRSDVNCDDGDKTLMQVCPVVRRELLTNELRREELPDVFEAALIPRDREAYRRVRGNSGWMVEFTNCWESVAALRSRSLFVEHLLTRDNVTPAERGSTHIRDSSVTGMLLDLADHLMRRSRYSHRNRREQLRTNIKLGKRHRLVQDDASFSSGDRHVSQVATWKFSLDMLQLSHIKF